jgi:glycosyltransferase involved in cell wall biosynthesis
MPFILKEPYENSKGVIVFTHKERQYLETTVPVLQKAISRLQEKYVIGIHWGHYHPEIGEMAYVDFHLAGEGTISLKPGVQARRIPLCSRNFTPSCFREMGIAKYWDILNISRPIKQKNLAEFLSVIRKVYDRHHRLKVLLICPCPEKMEEHDGWYRGIYDDYTRMFSPVERQTFTLMMLKGDGYPFPLSQQMVAYCYNASQIFTLFSDEEGESRVIAEALVCGLPVVFKKHLRGGGADFLTETNSRQFSSLDEACEIFVELSQNYDRYRFDTLALQKQLSESYTAELLEKEIKSLFAAMRLDFRGSLDLSGLALKLPGHCITLPRFLRLPNSNDLISHNAALFYLKSLIGGKVSNADICRLYSGRFHEKFSKVQQRLFQRTKRWLKLHEVPV